MPNYIENWLNEEKTQREQATDNSKPIRMLQYNFITDNTATTFNRKGSHLLCSLVTRYLLFIDSNNLTLINAYFLVLLFDSFHTLQTRAEATSLLQHAYIYIMYFQKIS